MNRSGWKHGVVAVLIGAVLGLGGLAGQPTAQAAAGSGVSSEGGYSERRPCGGCYEREPACENRRPCDPCADSTPKNQPEDRCADSKKACERQGERRDDDDDRYDRKKKERSALHKLLRGVFD